MGSKVIPLDCQPEMETKVLHKLSKSLLDIVACPTLYSEIIDLAK